MEYACIRVAIMWLIIVVIVVIIVAAVVTFVATELISIFSWCSRLPLLFSIDCGGK